MIENFVPNAEGPNTRWSPTAWTSLAIAQRSYPDQIYRELEDGGVEMLTATEEGPNGKWVLAYFDSLEDAQEEYPNELFREQP
jgi:hypothetical protein